VEWSFNIEAKVFVQFTLSWCCLPLVNIDDVPFLVQTIMLSPCNDSSVFIISSSVNVKYLSFIVDNMISLVSPQLEPSHLELGGVAVTVDDPPLPLILMDMFFLQFETIVYVDQWKAAPGKGELNEDFGLYVERPFHIVSQLPDNRYLDHINNRNMVIKTPNGRNTQEWYFHQQSLTIRTKYNNQSWDIKNSGKTKDMQIWSTNSQWW
jgi:hypothetical protein